ncbi:MAG: serine hydrolase [Chitinophagaceae bacterium]
MNSFPAILIFCVLSLKVVTVMAFAPLACSGPGIAHQPFFQKDTSQPLTAFTRTDRYFEDLLKQGPPELKPFLDAADSLGIQIIYTRIDRKADNSPDFTRYHYRVNPEKYFYPASTVKMPVALLALQKLNELKVFGLNENSAMITEAAHSGQTPVYNDPAFEDGRPTIAGYIKKIFLVSDNDSFNRLYEFLGQQYINERLHSMGYGSADILHRLYIPLSEEENRNTNPVSFFSNTGKSLYTQPLTVSHLKYPLRNDSAGHGYLDSGKLIQTPLNFSRKNRLPLEDLTSILQSILFPQSMPASKRFNLRPDQYPFLWKYMSQYPTETGFPLLDSSIMHDGYVKFLLYGADRNPLSKTLRLFNKPGDAYGFLTDIAYIADLENNVEFMLSATLYCNRDGILNDDRYDYETIGFPFMKLLGNYIYEVEKKRIRSRAPNLSQFRIVYDK